MTQTTAADSGLAGCHMCGRLTPVSEHHCPLCGGTLHQRNPDSLQRTVALLCTSVLLYIPANVLPIMTTSQLGRTIESTMLGGVVLLVEDGSYPIAGVIFIAQVLGFDLTIMQQAIVVITALLASIGAAAVPSAGLVVIFIVLEAIGLRGPNVNLIVGSMLAIDRPLDMYRTSVNVFSDSCGAAIIARSEGETEVDAVIR